MRLTARLSMIFAVLSVPLVIGAILLLWYVPMGIFILLAAHCFYMTPFYYKKYEDLSRTALLLEALEKGASAPSECAGVSEEYAAVLLKRAFERGYISNEEILN